MSLFDVEVIPLGGEGSPAQRAYENRVREEYLRATAGLRNMTANPLIMMHAQQATALIFGLLASPAAPEAHRVLITQTLNNLVMAAETLIRELRTGTGATPGGSTPR